jgi:PIN domain nuclease of toxin-antitoxin system
MPGDETCSAPVSNEVAIDGRIGIRAAELEQLHRDPADRLIVASAIELGARLMTADQIILDWPGDLLRFDARD